jgi:Type I restriction enzyme HindI endonuclease subunit-like, C-terminal
MRTIAGQVTAAVRNNVTINWTLRENVRGQLRLEQQFLDEGGFTEKLYRTRMQARKNRG